MFEVIVCSDINNGIGKDNTIPWYCKEDIQRFKKITTNAPNGKINVVIMGNNTYKSIGKHLPNRLNLILTNQIISKYVNSNLNYFNNYEDILKFIYNSKDVIHKVFIIGGAKIYKLFLNLQIVSTIHITKIFHDYNCDTFIELESFKYYKQTDLTKSSFDNILINYITMKYYNKDEDN